MVFRHVPSQQLEPAVQACIAPQPPQFATSVLKLVHLPAQQLSPCAQLVAQLPQCSASVMKSNVSSTLPLQSSSRPLQLSAAGCGVTHVSSARPRVHCSTPIRHRP